MKVREGGLVSAIASCRPYFRFAGYADLAIPQQNMGGMMHFVLVLGYLGVVRVRSL